MIDENIDEKKDIRERIFQQDIAPTAVKSRHIGEGEVQAQHLWTGEADQVLTMVGGVPTWQDLTTTSTWSDYTVTDTGSFTVGNGTLLGRYTQTGDTVSFTCQLTFGSTSSVSAGQLNFGSLPVTASTGTLWSFPVFLHDSGSAVYAAMTGGSTNLRQIGNSSGICSNTNPFTWATGDEISISGTYEAA